MKKLLIAGIILCMGVQTFSYVPAKSSANISYSLPRNLNAMALQEFLKLTPKKYQELTGKKMTLKQKIAFCILKAKLKKQLPDDKAQTHKTDIGLLSLIFGGGAFVLAIIPFVGLLSIPMSLAAIILGIIGLGRKKGDTKSIIGLVLGSVFLFLFVIVFLALLINFGYK